MAQTQYSQYILVIHGPDHAGPTEDWIAALKAPSGMVA